jgi:hypothetical protein
VAKYVSHPDAESAALDVFAAGGTKEDASKVLAARFADVPAWQRTQAVVAAIAQIIEERLTTGEIEKWLDQASGVDVRRMTKKERKKHEAKIEQVWQAFDSLLEEEATPLELIASVRKLNRLLPELGWQGKLPRGLLGTEKGR